jgi:hypothetical protein
MVDDHFRRRMDTFKFFQVETTRETRLEILRRYKITHILFRRKDTHETVRDKLNVFGNVEENIDEFVLIKLRNDI